MNDTYTIKYKFWQPPKPVGAYKVGDNFYITFIKKPNWLNRKFTEMILGWTWVDYD